jgi:hypothetical protein
MKKKRIARKSKKSIRKGKKLFPVKELKRSAGWPLTGVF